MLKESMEALLLLPNLHPNPIPYQIHLLHLAAPELGSVL